MAYPVTILYIPGLGNTDPTSLQMRYIATWRNKYNLVIFEPKWSSEESYEVKYRRLVACFNTIASLNVHIVAVSAGGSLATRLLSECTHIKKAHFVSTKVRGIKSIGAAYQKRAPALIDAVLYSETLLSNKPALGEKAIIYRPVADLLIPLNDMVIEGAKRKRVPAIGHTIGIAMALLFFVKQNIASTTSEEISGR